MQIFQKIVIFAIISAAVGVTPHILACGAHGSKDLMSAAKWEEFKKKYKAKKKISKSNPSGVSSKADRDTSFDDFNYDSK